jgi:hypothetical protein
MTVGHGDRRSEIAIKSLRGKRFMSFGAFANQTGDRFGGAHKKNLSTTEKLLEGSLSSLCRFFPPTGSTDQSTSVSHSILFHVCLCVILSLDPDIMGKTKLTPQQRKAVAASVLEEGLLPASLPSTSGLYRPAPAAPPPATHVHQYDFAFFFVNFWAYVCVCQGGPWLCRVCVVVWCEEKHRAQLEWGHGHTILITVRETHRVAI